MARRARSVVAVILASGFGARGFRQVAKQELHDVQQAAMHTTDSQSAHLNGTFHREQATVGGLKHEANALCKLDGMSSQDASASLLTSVADLDMTSNLGNQLQKIAAPLFLEVVSMANPLLGVAYGILSGLLFPASSGPDLKTQILDEVKTMISKNNDINLLEDKEDGLRNFLSWMDHNGCGHPTSLCYSKSGLYSQLSSQLTTSFQGVFLDVWNDESPDSGYRSFLRKPRGGVAVLLQVQFTELAVGTYVSMLDSVGEKHAMGHLNELRHAVKLIPQNFRQYEKWREAWIGWGKVPAINVQCRDNAPWHKKANYTCETPGATDPVTGDIFCSGMTHTSPNQAGCIRNVKISARKCFPTHQTNVVMVGLQKLQKQIQAVSRAVEALSNRLLPLNYDCKSGRGYGSRRRGAGSIEEIRDFEDCKRAGKAFSNDSIPVHKDSWSHLPKGCQLIGRGKPEQIRFNDAKGGSRKNVVSRPICKLTF